MKKYKYLLFDADNTLFDFNECERRAFGVTFAKLGIESSDSIYDLYHHINAEIWKEFEKGLIEREVLKYERYRRLFEKLGVENVNCKEVASAYELNLAEQALEFDGAAELLGLLSENYEIYIVTNGLAYVQEHRFEKSGFVPYIKKVYISERLGAQKPSALFFDRVIEDIGDSNRSKYLVIGDSLTSDIDGAINSSLDCCWLNHSRADSDGRNITYTVYDFSDIKALLNI